MKYKLSIIGSLVYCAVGVAFTSCYNEYDAPGETVKDWAGTSERFVPTDERGFTTFYTPYMIKPTDNVGGVGDPMPFYDAKNSEFKVLYLQDYANNKAYCFHPYWGLKTKDCSSYESLGEILSVGSNDFQQDAALGTGCCFYNEADGLYYIYYTGENGKCTNRQVVMRATSHDFKTWTRDNLWQLNGPEYGYNGFDFRDPQIFKGDDGKFHMVIATRPQAGGDGVFAEFVSADMKNWESAGDFPMLWNRFCECPDVFKMGDWWYLVYSEAFQTSWSRKVKYMMARTWEDLKKCFGEPKIFPNDGREGVLDSRAFYAGKTASNGTDRYIWGWCPYRPVEDIDARNINVGAGDGNEPKWGGALVCHKVLQHEDGTLTLTAVPSLNNKYNKPQTVREMESKGYANGKLTGEGAYVLYNRLGYHNHMSFTVKTAGNTDKFGVSLFRGSDSKKYYTMVFNPEGENDRKINMEQEGAEGKGFIEAVDSYKFQRPADNVYNIDIYTDNSVFVIYVNDNICYTMRLYGIQKNCWSINNYGGEIEVSNLKVSAY